LHVPAPDRGHLLLGQLRGIGERALGVAKALRGPAIQDCIYGFGLVPSHAPSGELATLQQTQLRRWEAPIKASGFKAE